MDDYNLYEKRKNFLDNKSRKGNDFAWIMDKQSVCISENGDGCPIYICEIDLPSNTKVGEVYEKIDGKYVYNSEVSMTLNELTLEEQWKILDKRMIKMNILYICSFLVI